MHVINILNNCNCAWLVAGLLLYTYFLCYEEDKEGGGGGGGGGGGSIEFADTKHFNR